MTHLSLKPTLSARLLLSARLALVLGLSLALWLALGWGLAGASRLPGSAHGTAGGEVAYNFALQGTCDITVTNDLDSGPGSLRQAIADACDGGHVTFDNDYTIYLTTTLEITRRLTIDGEAHTVAVSGDSGGDGTPNVRVFSIASGGVATLTHLSIVSGMVTGSTSCPTYCGGGILNQGTLTVQNSTLSANSAGRGGGGIDNSGTLTVQNSTLSGNSANYGGGISNYGPLTVQNSTLSGNSATNGGGIYNSSTSTLTVQNSTLAGNLAGYGGGISNYGTLNLSHTLIAYSPGSSDCVGSPLTGVLITNDHNLIQGTGGFACGIANGAGGSIIGVDPLLGPLADYGGETQTYALLPGSPAIDAGAACLATDQRGIARPQGAACDIGAFESRGGFSLALVGGDNQSTPIYTTFAQPLSVAVSSAYGEPVGPGGVITFTAPSVGASLNPAVSTATTNAGGAASVTVTANGLVGSYAYAVTATATGVITSVIFNLSNTPAPAMAVLGNGQVIPDGDSILSAADGTDFGNVAVGQALTHTFTISNRGTLDLTLTGSPVVSITGPAALDFSLVAPPTTPVAPGATTTFQVRFTPSVTVTRVAIVTIANNDPVKAPYDFAIQGSACYSVITVTNAADSGPGSLRQAIADVCDDGGRVTFDNDYTIYLTTTLEITRQLTIDGGTHAITVSGDSGGDGTPNVRVFSIASSSVATLTHLSIVDGRATAGDTTWDCPDDCGGGIYNYGRLTVQNSILSGNSAGGFGGGIYNERILSVEKSTFVDNRAISGGGIYHSAATLWVTNSTFSGNSAGTGGGIYGEAVVIVQNSTLAGNRATSWGGGIYNYYGNLYLYNTLIANSPQGNDCAGTGVDGNRNSLIADGSCSSALSGAAYLGPLGDYGGDTPTIPLLPGSPALDAGTSCESTDQRGVARPQGAACDIGAFESRGGFSLALVGGDNQRTPIYTTFAQPLSVAVSSAYGEPVGPGAAVRFSAPGEGASLSPALLTAATDAGGAAGVTATANSLDGSYIVTATVQGLGASIPFSLTNTPGPTMAVLGNGQVIADGDATPAVADDTDFGGMVMGQSLTHTFTISNRGTQELTLTGSPAISIGGPAALDFSLVASPALALAPDTTTTFQVRFTPSVTGLAVATITIASNDLVRTPYDFAVQGQLCSYDITVTDATDDGPGSLRQAIANACDGGRITFAGDYTIYLTTSLTISKRLTIDASGHAVAVSGDSGGDGTADVRVFSVRTNSVVTLTHLSIVSGTASSGGGIYNQGTLTIQDSIFAGNSANSGGGIHSYWGTLVVENSTFTGNSAATYGGGIHNQRALTVTGSTFYGNSAREGGGIASSGSISQIVQNSTFTGNSAATYGGDIFSSSRLTVQNCSFAGNSTAARGGSLYNLGGALVVQNSALSGNSATDDGGGIYNANSSGILTVTNSTLSGNLAADDGGGIYNYGTLTVQNSTFSGNSVLSYGGGIYNRKTLVVTNSTFAGNSAVDGGGGIFSEDTLRLYNTLIAHSPAGGDCQGNVAANDHNLIESIHSNACLLTNGSGGSLIGVDPRLAPLGDYGGDTPTISLLPGSPALDAGNAGTCLATDQRGIARPQGATCDIGAFESQGFDLTLAGGDNQSASINTPFAQPLSVVLSSAAGEPVGPGGVISFTAPAAGASLVPAVLTATTDVNGAAGVTATANGLTGSYGVTATARGVGTPVTFTLTNTPPAPAMAVLGNGQVILDGDSTPSPADGADFGNVNMGQVLTRTFTISNGGTLDLTLTGSPVISIGGPAALDFSLVASPALTVAPGATTTFQVRFTPSLTGTRVATITIANDDPARNPYDFAIQGAASDERYIFLPVILREAP